MRKVKRKCCEGDESVATPVSYNLRRGAVNSKSTAGTDSSICSPSSKLMFLLDWWLIKADAGSHGRRLGVGGFSSKENNGIRSFASAAILKRHDAVTLETVDGIMVMINGHLNKSRTDQHGFPAEVYDHFEIGFPYYWEEFTAVSLDKKQTVSSSLPNGTFSSDTYKTPSRKDPLSNIENFDDTPSNVNKARDCRKQQNRNTVELAGPLTRSRSRLAVNPG